MNQQLQTLASSTRLAPVFVDHTHLGRHVTGLERITLELFSNDSLSPLTLQPVTSSGTPDLIARQNLLLPWKLARHPRALMLCPGFPPGFALQLFGRRVIPYIHDLFLINRTQDLNARARLYMAPPFRRAVRRLPFFLVNSQYTADELRPHTREGARIQLYRPGVRNVFGLSGETRGQGGVSAERPLRLIALGTVEPRKNLLAAARILQALRASGHKGAALDIVGRFGWGDDVRKLQATPGVVLHGYQPIEKIRELMDRADLFINTSHDEGLGLPLLEAQYAGLPVVAPDQQVFREVLAGSGLLIDSAKPDDAAIRIKALIGEEGWRARHKALAAANLQRWNNQVAVDRSALVERLMQMASTPVNGALDTARV